MRTFSSRQIRLSPRNGNKWSASGVDTTVSRHAVLLAVSLLSACTTFDGERGHSEPQYWLARDARTGEPVLLRIDEEDRHSYFVQHSWSPATRCYTRVARIEWTQCYLGSTPPADPEHDIESIHLSREGTRAELTVAIDIFSGGWLSYQCTSDGPVF